MINLGIAATPGERLRIIRGMVERVTPPPSRVIDFSKWILFGIGFGLGALAIGTAASGLFSLMPHC